MESLKHKMVYRFHEEEPLGRQILIAQGLAMSLPPICFDKISSPATIGINVGATQVGIGTRRRNLSFIKDFF